ncbi:glycosyltransferase [Flexivirga sp. B27]
MIVFFDPKHDRGGGQVVLERLLELLSAEPDIRLVMPQDGYAAITAPAAVQHLTTSAELTPRGESVTLVANANSAFPDLVRTARRLRAAGNAVRTVAIVHNYPLSVAKGAVTKGVLRFVDVTVAVEPGLRALRADILTPSWLSVQDGTRAATLSRTTIGRTGRVKSYGRPDKSKGLHLLPAVFSRLQAEGFSCEVALGNALQEQESYRTRLATDLAPWLTDGPRTPAWIDPGDIFVVPSIGGEAACLSAQEALSNGAFVVASRLGLMPYLSPTRQGMRTFAVGDTDGATDAIREALTMPSADYSAELAGSTAAMAQRAGRWYAETVQIILDQQSA